MYNNKTHLKRVKKIDELLNWRWQTCKKHSYV